jgi:signal transduction histidine kinase
MRTLLANLLENAWKYTSGVTAPRVTFGCRPDEDGGRSYEVADNGVGFDMRFADKLFKPFRRLHSAADFPGMGLGLATVARIVRRYGGDIRGGSVIGQGSAFRFTLPVAEIAPEQSGEGAHVIARDSPVLPTDPG